MRVNATKFNGIVDELGLQFSERWARDGNGEWCYGKISFVFVKRSRAPQKYRILYHDGTTMTGLEKDIEMAPDATDESETASEGAIRDRAEMELNVEDREEESDPDYEDQEDIEDESEGEVRNVRIRARAQQRTHNEEAKAQNSTTELEDSDDDKDDADTVNVGGVLYEVGKRKRDADTVTETGGELEVGGTVTAGNLTWERIEGLNKDCRTEPHFDTTFKTHLFNEDTKEVDVFLALMPLSKNTLLTLVRENAENDNANRVWSMWHIEAALAIIFGGAQFKEGTDLWATQRVGLMPPPDFGRQLSRDRFQRILRYWGRGLEEERGNLKDNPWAVIDPWIKGFNASRRREINPGTLLTPDEMMMEWRGKSGFGGLPHLSYIKRKPKPLGTELKSVCEGTMGICINIEIQKGKIAMARKKWAKDYSATTACTLRLIDQLHISEIGEVSPPRRCVFADSWFASVATVLALRERLGLDFTGPVKTAHANFPLDSLRFTVSKKVRGDFVVYKCLEHVNLWAVAWHDHHFKCYITTHGVTTPGKPAPKRRQDKEGHNWLKEVPRPHVIAQYQHEMGYVDRHNNFRQGSLHLAKVWKTKRWQTRIQLELLGMSMVDAFLACRKIMPKWKDMEDSESIFFKFMHVVTGQLDSRPWSDRNREGEDNNPSHHCKHLPLGTFTVGSGNLKGTIKRKQNRCKYCKIRMKMRGETGRSPHTTFGCSFHEVAVCKKFNCWDRHLAEVQNNHSDEFAI